jgi:threonine/homoserine/homoserine lactone efflux protein
MTLFAAFVVFALTTLFTPGPNNAMLMASGLTFGWRRAIPHLLGVSLGFGLMVALVGLGLGALIAQVPAFYVALKYIGAAYLLYLAWKIATADPHGGLDGRGGRPIGFVAAALFQWVNPKAWIMAVGAVSTYAGMATYPWNVAIMVGVFTLGGLASSSAWVGLGTVLQRILTRPERVRVVNVVLALLLVASVVPVLAEHLLR